MSEPRHPPPPGGDRSAEAEHVAPAPAAPPPEVVVPGAPAEPTDDSPTVISRHVPRQASAEEVFGTGLRGCRLAHFELIEPIGVGGMAAVLRARDTQLDRCVALKILPPEMAADPENVRRFHQEARNAAKLDHENIARVFFYGEDRRLHFIAFEFVEGENLRTTLERRGRLPVGEALQYMVQVAAGLTHAAQRGVVHRDIKPSNIIITPNGRAKLVDMGLARSLEPQADRGLTHSGVTLGTFDYISPEQALEPREADVRSDIYSLGCTFYHVLTGHPPVPEGTALKKLHHHQHVRPPDPRQLVPDLPDDVAVILDRMMAKEPRDRYQSPEQLVHHLLLAARKLGVAPEVPEGVLSVETDLPNRASGRPLLLAALAAAAVVVLVLVLDQSPSMPTLPAPPPTVQEEHQPRDANGPAPGTATSSSPEGTRETAPRVRHEDVARVVYPSPGVADVRQLAEWLSHHRKQHEIIIELADDLDASPGVDRQSKAQGLVVEARKVTLRARAGSGGSSTKTPGRRPTVRFTYNGYDMKPTRAAFTIEAREATVSGLRFVVDARGSEAPMAGLLFRGGLNHHVENCEFIQAQPSSNPARRLTSLLVEARREESPGLDVQGCCFLGFKNLETRSGDTSVKGRQPEGLALTGVDPGGQDAVGLSGPVQVTASNCAFGPHAATFHLEVPSGRDASGGPGPHGWEGSQVNVRHCTVLAARNSAVFDLAAGAGIVLDVRHSLFGRPGDPERGPPADGGFGAGAVLIRQGDSAARVTYQGNDNRYYNLDSYWVGGGRDAVDWEDFQTRLQNGQGKDDRSQPLLASPWQAPDDRPLKLLEEQALAQAFQVDSQRVELRQADKPDHLVGVEELLGAQAASLPSLEGKKPGPEPRRLVVDPSVSRSGNGTYRGLEQAVLDARPGDVIRIRCDGELRVGPLALDREEMRDLTIRPYPGRHPVLKLGGTDPDAALFAVHAGRLVLDGLEFRLRPDRAGFKAQAVVDLIGNGQCVFKDCIITLDRAGQETALAVATLAEAGKAMTADMPGTRPAEQGPHLALDGCLVRGEGDLVWSRASRPCDLDVKNTLAALTGSLLNVDVGPDASAASSSSPKTSKTAPAAQKVHVGLTQVTTYLGGNLIRIHADRDLRGLVPIECKPTGCLFLPSAAGGPLVHLDGPEADEMALRDKIVWESGGNAYGNFSPMLDQQPPGEEAPLLMSLERWKSFTGEVASKYGARLPAPLEEDALTRARPTQFKPEEDLKGYGADVSQLSELTRGPDTR